MRSSGRSRLPNLLSLSILAYLRSRQAQQHQGVAEGQHRLQLRYRDEARRKVRANGAAVDEAHSRAGQI